MNISIEDLVVSLIKEFLVLVDIPIVANKVKVEIIAYRFKFLVL